MSDTSKFHDGVSRMIDAEIDAEIEARSTPKESGKSYDFSRFNELMDAMQEWRDRDQFDFLRLSRDQVVELIEGVKALHAAYGEARQETMKWIRSDGT